MRTATALVLLALIMCITVEVNGLVSSHEQQTNEDVTWEVSTPNDEDILEDEELYDTKILNKRRLKQLKFPGDCKAKTLVGFARKCGLTVEAGGSHWVVKDGKKFVTTIPHTVKSNGTCKSIIKTLNRHCA